jgi:hypothetical protein
MGQVTRSAAVRAHCLRAGLLALTGLACNGQLASTPPSKENSDVAHHDRQHALSASLEAELAEIRPDPLAAVGFGEKAYSPYELVKGDELVRSRDPEVLPRLLAEALDGRNDRIFRLVMLQILGLRTEAAVDAALVAALADPVLRPLAAYFLGRAGFKGYPSRERRTVAPLLRALAAHLGDPGVYEDPWYRRSHATGDLVLGAFIRIAGPEAFAFADPTERDFVGYTLRFPKAERASLLEQAKRHPIPAE